MMTNDRYSAAQILKGSEYLKKDEQAMVCLHFGFKGSNCLTYNDMAKHLQVSESFIQTFFKNFYMVLEEHFQIKKGMIMERDLNREYATILIEHFTGLAKKINVLYYGIGTGKYSQLEIAKILNVRIKTVIDAIRKMNSLIKANFSRKFTKEVVEKYLYHFTEIEQYVLMLYYGLANNKIHSKEEVGMALQKNTRTIAMIINKAEKQLEQYVIYNTANIKVFLELYNRQLKEELTFIEYLVIDYKYNKNTPNESIARVLDIPVLEVEETIKRFINTYKNNIVRIENPLIK